MDAQEKRTPKEILNESFEKQREYFEQGHTKSPKFRRETLTRLLEQMHLHREALLEALSCDLHKSSSEALMSEYMPTMNALKVMRRKVKTWSASHSVLTSWMNFPALGWIKPEPYGVVGIVAAWNYPLLLAMEPLIGAVAAGNCVILRPAPAASFTARVLEKIVAKSFDPEHVTVDFSEPDDMAAHGFDYFFFTGGGEMGRKVMRNAADHLTPVTLELGGKSPCVVMEDADLAVTAKRIVWGKFLNAGQTCVAPDYLLVQRAVKDELLLKIRRAITDFFSTNPQNSPDFGRIINEYHFERLSGLLNKGRLIAGGERVESQLYVAPTVVDQISWDDPVMQQEIFGPILPVLEFETEDEVIGIINHHPKPLALYLFTKSRKYMHLIANRTSSGALCINETIMHLVNEKMPFGGVGASGIGAYHGKRSFDTFSHDKPVMRRTFLPDLPLRYPPFTPWKRKMIEFFGK